MAGLKPVFGQSLVVGTIPAVQLVSEGDGPTYIYNSDVANTLYIGDDNAITFGDTSDIAPLGPQAGLAVDGTRDIFGTVVPNKPVNVVLYPTGENLAPPPSLVAASIAISGVSLLSAANIVVNQSNIAIAGNGTTTLGPFPISQIGYEIGVDVQSSGNASIPLTSVTMQWSDTLTGRIVAQEKWFLAVGNAVFKHYQGTGPTKGDTLTIVIKNHDATLTSTVNIGMAQNSRVTATDDWRTYDNVAIPQWGNPSFDPASGLLCSVTNIVVNASGGQCIRLLPLYNGLVSFMATQSVTGSATLIFASLVNQTPIIGYGNMYQAGIGGSLNTGPVQIPFPRSPVLMTFTNNGAAAVTFNLFVSIVRTPASG